MECYRQAFMYTGDATDNILRLNAGNGNYTGNGLEVQIARTSNEHLYNIFRCVSSHDSNPDIRFNVRGDGLTHINGDVYIGHPTSTAQNTLQVQGSGITLSEGDKDRVSIHPATSGSDAGTIIFKTRGGGNPIERLRIDHDGDGVLTGTLVQNSDESIKENVQSISDGLAKVNQLRGVSFTRNDQEDSEKVHLGVVAQEVESILPEIVSETNGLKGVAYTNMVAVIIEAVKELSAKVEALENA